MAKTLTREELKALIQDLLRQEATCVIATCSGDVPRASAVEFFPEGLVIYILTEGGLKVENIERNPRVSVAVHAPFRGWEGLRGLQITGAAAIGRKGTEIFEEGRLAYAKRRGTEQTSLPDVMKVIKVTPERMEYIDSSLGGRGCAIRQVILF